MNSLSPVNLIYAQVALIPAVFNQCSAQFSEVKATYASKQFLEQQYCLQLGHFKGHSVLSASALNQKQSDTSIRGFAQHANISHSSNMIQIHTHQGENAFGSCRNTIHKKLMKRTFILLGGNIQILTYTEFQNDLVFCALIVLPQRPNISFLIVPIIVLQRVSRRHERHRDRCKMQINGCTILVPSLLSMKTP